MIQYDGSLQPLIWTRWDVSKTRCCSRSSVYRPHDPEVPSLEQLLINNIITDWNTVQNDAVNAIGQWFSSRTTWPGGGSTWIGSNLRGVMSRPAWCNLKWGSRGVQLFFVTFSSVKKKNPQCVFAIPRPPLEAPLGMVKPRTLCVKQMCKAGVLTATRWHHCNKIKKVLKKKPF